MNFMRLARAKWNTLGVLDFLTRGTHRVADCREGVNVIIEKFIRRLTPFATLYRRPSLIDSTLLSAHSNCPPKTNEAKLYEGDGKSKPRRYNDRNSPGNTATCARAAKQ